MTYSDVAVLIPCLNEELTVSQVIHEAMSALPSAAIYVYDNGSNDDTVECARKAGATVRREAMRGKGNVVRRMFADIDAEIYVMVDGDSTYEIAAAPNMIELLRNEDLDIVTGVRTVSSDSVQKVRRGHEFGNRLFTAATRILFGSDCKDALSGYRVMSRRFVKSFPVDARGFEIEVALMAHIAQMQSRAADYDTVYFDRPNESSSKLRTYTDGIKILRKLVALTRLHYAFRFYGTLAIVPLIASLLLWYNDDNPVSQLNGLSIVTFLMAFLLFTSGVIVSAVNKNSNSIKKLIYLSYRSVKK